MTPLFIPVLLAAVSLECRAQTDNVLQPKGDVTAAEGEAVTLGCQYISTSSNDYLFWYKQDGNNSPKFILSRFTFGSGKTEDEEKYSSTLNSTSRSVPLKIQKLLLSDSAVYYCALQPAGGLSKILFGAGSRLTVEAKIESPPSFYKLTDGNISACLATDFSINASAKNENGLFNETEAVQMKDGLYSQVALVPPGDERCDQDADISDPCDEALQPDPKVNLMSLTILGLRLLFFKTVVFNVLMTLRLWTSQ